MERCSEIQMEMDSEIQEFPEIQPIPGPGIVSPSVLVRIEILRDSLLSTSSNFFGDKVQTTKPPKEIQVETHFF